MRGSYALKLPPAGRIPRGTAPPSLPQPTSTANTTRASFGKVRRFRGEYLFRSEEPLMNRRIAAVTAVGALLVFGFLISRPSPAQTGGGRGLFSSLKVGQMVWV